MNPSGLKCILLLSLCLAPKLHAQTLNEQLLDEEPSKLVLQARERGDIVRGAILFHQGNIACAKCHKPSSEKDRIGPDISRLGDDVTYESIVESILLPSKVIKPEYKTVRILTLDGKVLSGSIVGDGKRFVRLRDTKDVNKILTIERDEIDSLVDAKTSLMPAELANELKSKQQFFDLLRYVLDLKDRGPLDDTRVRSVVKRELRPALLGHVALRQHNCAACHTLAPDYLQTASSAPHLRWSANNLNPDYLVQYISDPQALKPGTKMPQVFVGLDSDSRAQAAKAITHFLVSLGQNNYSNDRRDAIQPAAVKRGFDLFHSVGCVACHAPRNSSATEISLANSLPLGDISQKYSVAALTQFLENPKVARPHGRMPSLQLTHKEAVDLASFLLQKQAISNPDSGSPWNVDPDLVSQGRDLFESAQCSACHTDVIPNAKSVAKQSLADFTTGCLQGSQDGQGSETPTRAPKFSLTVSERSNIQAALASIETSLSPQDHIDISLTHFNCTSCHSRDNLGGVSDERSQYFQTTNLNLGEQGRIPPSLTGVGAKLKPKWMRDVLVNSRNIRPYMKTRMPQFGEENIGHLIDLFQKHDQLKQADFATFDDQKAMRQEGLELVGNKGLNCVACHTYQFKISDTMPAVDLTEMSDRLKKNWFYQYMLAPQAYSPNTVMPSFWPSGKSIRPDLPGTPEHQVEAVWQYLLDGRQARAPRGVIREPLEIVVKQKARMLRRSYPNIGKRGIGVGYPGGINIAYDAEQMRLALLWKGRFIDPSGVWYGQGHGRVRPMGPSISLAAGPELDRMSSPWQVDDGRPPNHQFQGYELDEQRRPTFIYKNDDVTVNDFFESRGLETQGSTDGQNGDEAQNDTVLLRRISLIASKSTDALSFRLLGQNFEIGPDGKQLKSEKLQIQILSSHQARVSNGPNGQQAIVPLQLTGGKSEELVLEYRW